MIPEDSPLRVHGTDASQALSRDNPKDGLGFLGAGIVVALLVHLTLLWTLTAHSKRHQERDIAVEMVFTPPEKPALQPPPSEIPLEAPSEMTTAPQPLPAEPEEFSPPVPEHLSVARPPVSASSSPHRPAALSGATGAAPQDSAARGRRGAGTAPASQPRTASSMPAAPASQAPGCRAMTPAYPASARVMRETGAAVVLLTVAPGGAVTAVRLEQSSGYDDLDDVAVAAAHEARCTNATGAASQLRLPVHFRLGAGTAGSP